MTIGSCFLLVSAAMLTGCSQNNSNAQTGNPGVTPPAVVQSAQQNQAAQAEWIKSHPGQMHP